MQSIDLKSRDGEKRTALIQSPPPLKVSTILKAAVRHPFKIFNARHKKGGSMHKKNNQCTQRNLQISSAITNAYPTLLVARIDRKSTRLNSSHLGISYAVFCLKKKKKKQSN